MTNQAPPTAREHASDDWDVVRTISELEKLYAHTMRVIEHTANRLARPVGIAADGTELYEHPLGQSVAGINTALDACHRKYGRDMYREALSMNGAIEVAPKPPKRDKNGRSSE